MTRRPRTPPAAGPSIGAGGKVTYRALDHLIRVAPQVNHRPPYWRPTPAPIDPTMLLEPAWSWRIVPGEPVPVVLLDAIGAYLAAASSCDVAHDALTHTGRRPPERQSVGYWLVDLPSWHGHQLPPPWGSRELPPGPVWIAGPTMRVLLDLADRGACNPPDVHDSWLGAVPMRLRRWTDVVKAARLQALQAGDAHLYDAVKVGYSQAITLMMTGEKSKVHRPDWGHTVRAQHAATFWWKAWSALQQGCPPVGLARVDELALTLPHAETLLNRQQGGLKVPLRIDPSGQQLGAFKPKAVVQPDQWATISAEPTIGGATA